MSDTHAAPIELWSWPTPNGHKVHIMLEELGLPYTPIPIDIGAGQQFRPEFLAITPNHRIPAIVDPDGPGGMPLSLFESGAILIYLAEKTGKLIPVDPRGRYACLQWLMFQMGGVGPMFGQRNHFHDYAPQRIPYAMERYDNEMKRLHRVLETRLSMATWLAGDEYSIADIATYPWLRHPENRDVDVAQLPGVGRWIKAMEARPGVQRGIEVLTEHRKEGLSDAEKEVLFGKQQFSPR